MEERFIRVTRTARYHVLGRTEAAREIWVVLHGYGQLARYFLNAFVGLEEGRCIVAPEGLSRFYIDEQHARVGSTWMTREDRLHEIEDQIGYLDALVAELTRTAMPGATVRVLGFSQGVATAARWLTGGSTKATDLICWAGTLPPELDRDALAAWRNMHVHFVAGEKDDLVTVEEMRSAAVRSDQAGVTNTLHLFSGAHKLEPVLLGRLFGGKV